MEPYAAAATIRQLALDPVTLAALGVEVLHRFDVDRDGYWAEDGVGGPKTGDLLFETILRTPGAATAFVIAVADEPGCCGGPRRTPRCPQRVALIGTDPANIGVADAGVVLHCVRRLVRPVAAGGAAQPRPPRLAVGVPSHARVRSPRHGSSSTARAPTPGATIPTCAAPTWRSSSTTADARDAMFAQLTAEAATLTGEPGRHRSEQAIATAIGLLVELDTERRIRHATDAKEEWDTSWGLVEMFITSTGKAVPELLPVTTGLTKALAQTKKLLDENGWLGAPPPPGDVATQARALQERIRLACAATAVRAAYDAVGPARRPRADRPAAGAERRPTRRPPVLPPGRPPLEGGQPHRARLRRRPAARSSARPVRQPVRGRRHPAGRLNPGRRYHPRHGGRAADGQRLRRRHRTQAPLAVRPPGAATRLALGRRRDRQGAHRHRLADVRVRRLPALGHGDLHRPGAEQARRPVRAGRDRVDDDHARPPPRRRPPRPRAPGSTLVPVTTEATTTTTSGPETVPFPFALPAMGDPVVRLQIPSIDVDYKVVEGVGLDQLKKGPGHFPESVLPGQLGNTRDRRAPHHARCAVLRRRRAEAGRRDRPHLSPHRWRARAAVHLRRDRDADRLAEGLRARRADDGSDAGDAGAVVVPSGDQRDRADHRARRARSGAVEHVVRGHATRRGRRQ